MCIEMITVPKIGLSKYLKESYEVDAIFCFILHTRKLRCKEVKQFAKLENQEMGETGHLALEHTFWGKGEQILNIEPVALHMLGKC